MHVKDVHKIEMSVCREEKKLFLSPGNHFYKDVTNVLVRA